MFCFCFPPFADRLTESTYFIQGVLQDRLGLVPFALGHVARGLAVQQDQSGRVFIGHLLEDVEGILQLLSSLFKHFTALWWHSTR